MRSIDRSALKFLLSITRKVSGLPAGSCQSIVVQYLFKLVLLTARTLLGTATLSTLRSPDSSTARRMTFRRSPVTHLGALGFLVSRGFGVVGSDSNSTTQVVTSGKVTEGLSEVTLKTYGASRNRHS